jgi:HEAT repeat protein
LKDNGHSIDLDEIYKGLRNEWQRQESLAKLTNLGQKSCGFLLQKIDSEDDDLLKCEIIQIIGYIKCPNSEERLIRLLNDPNWRVRFFAIDVLSNFEYDSFFNDLPKFILNENNDNVKMGAIIALGERGSKEDIEFLKNLSIQENYQSEKVSRAISISLENMKTNKSK